MNEKFIFFFIKWVVNWLALILTVKLSTILASVRYGQMLCAIFLVATKVLIINRWYTCYSLYIDCVQSFEESNEEKFFFTCSP